MLKKNVWKFAVAKNYNDCVKLSNLLLRPDGSVRPWNEFKREAQLIVGTSNRYLRTEYDTIVASAQMSRLWQEIQRDKHIFPFVQFDVVMDDHTSEICSPLHNVIMSVDDKRLIFFFPPNHFNCRTTLRKLRNGIPTPDVELPEIPEAFKNNVALSGEIFTDKNAYIENTPKKVLSMSDEFASRWQKYERFLNDKNYHEVQFGKDGGLKAIHIGHNFNKITGKFEKEVQDLFFKKGDEIILTSERSDIPGKKVDGVLNGKTFDISTIIGSGKNTIKRALNHSKDKNAQISILYFPDKEMFDLEWLNKSIKMYNGQTSYRFEQIIYVVNGQIIYIQ
ncbi:phage minor head protein [Elizabethkingia anophelis]|uniref:phage minor head protein n=1 Tax=Elizabethkingia anophelis TaxID=1117645 RepID=UPI0038914ABC